MGKFTEKIKRVKKYYNELRKKQNRQHKETPINWQIMKKLQVLQKNMEQREDEKNRNPKELGGR